MTKKSTLLYYEDLVGIKQPVVIHNYADIRFRNLDPREKYVAKFYLWAEKERPLRLEIFAPGSKSSLVKDFEFTLRPDWKKRNGKDVGTWTVKKYALGPRRQNGQARFVFGWPPKHPKKTTDVPFQVMADQLTDKGVSPQKRINAGLCPECGQPGQWQVMAMVCPEHGRFIG